MTDRNAGRLGPVWVWLIGLVIILVAILLLVDWVEDRDDDLSTQATPAEVASADPDDGADRAAAIAEVERVSTPIALSAIVPLGPEDTGIQVEFRGRAVGEAIAEGAWLRTGSGVVFVRIVDAEEPVLEAGDAIAGRGVVRHAPDRTARWLLEAEPIVDQERGRVVGDYYIETTADRLRRVPS